MKDSDPVADLACEIESLILKCVKENDIKIFHAVAALEAVKFNFLLNAINEAKEVWGDN